MSKVEVSVSPYYFSVQKRLFDVFFGLIALFFTWPIIALIGIYIYYDSGAPIFFAQKRMGQFKKSFTLYKLRSMKLHPHASKKQLLKFNQAPYPMFKMKNDPRYTKIGQWLSQAGVDELPQIINILRGEMSWVGPRPLPVEEAKQLPTTWDFRYQVRPGIVSEWAVNPERYQSLKKWRQLEIETVQMGNLENDMRLLIRTFNFLFKH